MKTSNYILILIVALFLFSSHNYSQKKPEKSDKEKKEKSYSDIITDKAVTDNGLFDVHKIDDKYFRKNQSFIKLKFTKSSFL